MAVLRTLRGPGILAARVLAAKPHHFLVWDEVIDSSDRFYPGRLPDLLARFLARDRIDEPFEHWS